MASKLRILLAALLLLSAPLASGAQAKTEVRLAVLAPSALLWLHAIAREEGFCADANTEVKELIAGGSPALLQAISSGSVGAGVGLENILMIDRALGETPAMVRHFDLARYYDPSFLVGK